MGLFDTFKDKTNALTIIEENFSIIGSTRHEIADFVIRTYKHSSNPNDILGVAFAYQWQGAKERRNAISYFEKFLSSHTFSEVSSKFIDEWSIYSTLSTLYEKEYEFDKSMGCLWKCIEVDKGTNPADYTRIGDILVKIDIQKAENFYLSLLNNTFLLHFKYQFEYALNDVLEKKKRGYVYKPRISINKINLNKFKDVLSNQ